MSVSPSSSPSESNNTHTNTQANVHEECLGRLKELMNEYDELERTEENLLEMLEKVRQEDGCLVRALDDEIFARIGGRPFDANNNTSSASTTTTTTKTNLEPLEVPLTQLENGTKQAPPPRDKMQSGADKPQLLITQTQAQPVETSAEAVEGVASITTTAATATAGPSKRQKRGHAGAATQQQSPQKQKLHNSARHLEANRHVQRREERVLARRKLEDALFADEDGDDDNDDDDLSSSSSS
jgi:hypothetical protein